MRWAATIAYAYTIMKIYFWIRNRFLIPNQGGTQMDKAYDLNDLGRRLKEAGLAESEEAAAKAYGIVKEWVVESAKISSTPLDDLGIPFINQLDAVVKPQIDKISDQVKTV